VFVRRQQPRATAEVLEQRRAVPRVLGGDPGDMTQHVDGALRHVAEVSERRRHYI
jgi:hypothetical protein